MYFDLTTIKSKFSDYSISKIVFTINNKSYTTKATDIWVGGPCPTLSGSGSSYTISGSKPTKIGSAISVAAPGGQNDIVSTITNSTWISNLVGSSSKCVFINKGNSSSYYWEGYGSKTSYPPTMAITWVPR
jgi:hypothetical protein